MYKGTILILLAIGWTIIGFLFQLDLTQRSGCIIFPETFLTPYRISFLVISITFLGICLLSRNENVRQKLVVSEFGIWLAILILLKGGYGGIPDVKVMGYDYVAQFIRVLNAGSYYRHLYFFNTIRKQIIVISLLSLALIVIKANVFALPIIDLQ